jgi:hypothetical protein
VKFFAIIACCVACATALGSDDAHEVVEIPITHDDRDHWAFQPLARPALPRVKSVDWPRNPIDAFILARLEQAGLQPAPAADATTLLRRVKFDLLGLPPTTHEVRSLPADADAQAYEDLVNRFLASPRYGEHWAQFWLDLARFAETDVFEHDHLRTEAWRYRDWVIAAFNSDMPYDRFIQLQIAGDELDPESRDASIATAFCLSGPDMPDINSQDERRHGLLNELVSTVGSAVLGLQLGCAQCHDHKYDPISQADFYRMRALFEPAVQVQHNTSVFTLANAESAAPSYVMLRGDFRRKGGRIEPGFPRVADPWDSELPADLKSSPQGRRTFLAQWLTRDDHPLTARVIANRIWQQHFGRGLASSSSDFGVMGEEPSHPGLLDWLAAELVRGGWSIKHLQRLILTSATYRQSSELSRTESTSAAPTSSTAAKNTRPRDPSNELLWQFPRRRLSGESIRDSLLFVADSLNLETGGPGVRPELPPELVETLLVNQWKTTPNPSQHWRRSIFVFARRNLRFPIFDAFDRPDANSSCARRNESTTANQSLLMLNSAQTLNAARRLASVGLQAADGDPSRAIQEILLRCYGREIDPSEQELLAEFVRDQVALIESGEQDLALPVPDPENVRAPVSAALVDVCLGLLNANEFIYVD